MVRALAHRFTVPLNVFAMLVLALGGFAAGELLRNTLAQSDDTSTIVACKGDRSGALRIVGEGKECLRGESLMIDTIACSSLAHDIIIRGTDSMFLLAQSLSGLYAAKGQFRRPGRGS